jgi:hypothetical protein
MAERFRRRAANALFQNAPARVRPLDGHAGATRVFVTQSGIRNVRVV